MRVLVEFEHIFAHSLVWTVSLSLGLFVGKRIFVEGWPGGTVRCFPGHFLSFLSLTILGFVFLSRASWGPRGPPIRNFEILQYPSYSSFPGFESFVPCVGCTAGPPSVSGLARQPQFLGCSGLFSFSISGMGGFCDYKWCCNWVVDVLKILKQLDPRMLRPASTGGLPFSHVSQS